MPFIILQSAAVKIEFEAQSTKLTVANFDNFTQEWKIEVKRHRNLLPNSVRAIFLVHQTVGKQMPCLLY